jgi:hypothetical protein
VLVIETRVVATSSRRCGDVRSVCSCDCARTVHRRQVTPPSGPHPWSAYTCTSPRLKSATAYMPAASLDTTIQTAAGTGDSGEEKGLLRGGKWLTNVRPLSSGATPGYDVGKVERQVGDGPEHADAAEPGSLRDHPVGVVPLSVIWAIQDGTRLRIRPFDGEWTVINLKMGDVVVFRGDVCHNGVGYSEPNYRVHAYIDSPVIKRNANFLFTCSMAQLTPREHDAARAATPAAGRSACSPAAALACTRTPAARVCACAASRRGRRGGAVACRCGRRSDRA